MELVILMIFFAVGLAGLWWSKRPGKQFVGIRADAEPIPVGSELDAGSSTDRDETAESLDAPDPEMFRILALGPSGSGKTVFLASVYESMFLPRKKRRRSFYLQTDDRSAAELRAVHRTVIDANAEWPPGTDRSTLRRHVFDVMMKDRRQIAHRLLRIEYVDYAGEHLDPNGFGDSARIAELRDYFHQANAVFVLLDGHKLAQYIRGEDAGLLYFQNRINATIQWVIDAPCPIHFVVTKWDLLRDIGEDNPDDPDSRLEVVRRVLERHENLHDLLNMVDQNRVRLIPVSAVGDGFAKIGSDNRVKKIEGVKPKPVNIEIPFIAAFPDFLASAQAQLEEGRIHELRKTIENASSGKLADRLRKRWGQIQRYAPFLPVRGPIVAGVDLVAHWAIRSIERRDDQHRAQVSSRAGAELDELERVRMFLRQLERITNRFDDTHPEALLKDPLVGSGW